MSSPQNDRDFAEDCDPSDSLARKTLRLEAYLDPFETLDNRQFEIAIKRLANDLSYGTDASPFVGSGVEYVQSRPYQPGDSVRSIDWHVTARTGKHFVKEFEAPKRMPVYVIVDTSASMTIATTKHSKYFWAVHIAGGLALACLDRVSPVGVLAVGERQLHMKPSLSKPQIMQWLAKLRRYRYNETTTLARRLTELLPSLGARALLIVISDLHDPAALGVLKYAGHAHDCVVLQTRDPAEDGVGGVGFVRIGESETGTASQAWGIRPKLDQEGLKQSLRRAGIDHLVVPTDRAIAHRLRDFFKSRGLLGRGAR